MIRPKYTKNSIALAIMLSLTVASFFNAGKAEASRKKAEDTTALSRKAKRALDKGLKESKRGNWKEAIEKFKEARESAPHEPHCLFNLALSYDKINQPVRAIAWYNAYLLSAPGADNSKDVENRINELETSVRNDLKKMLEMSENAMASLEEYYKDGDPEFFPGPYSEPGSTTYESSMKSSRHMGDYYKISAYSTLSSAQASIGEFDKAKLTAGRILTCTNYDEYKQKYEVAYMWISYYYATRGYPDKAVSLAKEKLTDPEYIDGLYHNIAEIEFDRGNIEFAEKILKDIQVYYDEGKISNQGNIYGYFKLLLYMDKIDKAKEIMNLITDQDYLKGAQEKYKEALEGAPKKHPIDRLAYHAHYHLWEEYYDDLHAYIKEASKEIPGTILTRISSAAEMISTNLLEIERLANL